MADSSEPSPPTPVSALLGVGLQQHAAALKDLGYDNVSEFRNISEDELTELISELETKHNITLGHRNRIKRVLLGQMALAAPAPAPAEPLLHAAPAPAPAEPLPHDSPVPPPPHATPPINPVANAHKVKVDKLLNSDTGDRLIYGRKNPFYKPKPYEAEINRVAKEEAAKYPELLRWGDGDLKTGQLRDHVTPIVNATYDFSTSIRRRSFASL